MAYIMVDGPINSPKRLNRACGSIGASSDQSGECANRFTAWIWFTPICSMFPRPEGGLTFSASLFVVWKYEKFFRFIPKIVSLTKKIVFRNFQGKGNDRNMDDFGSQFVELYIYDMTQGMARMMSPLMLGKCFSSWKCFVDLTKNFSFTLTS